MDCEEGDGRREGVDRWRGWGLGGGRKREVLLFFDGICNRDLRGFY